MNEELNSPAIDDVVGRPALRQTQPTVKRPSKILPSPRLTVSKQLDALRAFALVAKSEDGFVSNEQAGKIINMSPNTIVVCNAFFCEVGFLTRKDSGKFEVSDVARAYCDAYEWNPETAGSKLAVAFEDKWFAKTLIPRLKMREWSRTECAQVLAEAAEASTEYRANVDMILDFLAAANLIKIEGSIVKATAPAQLNEQAENGSNRSAPVDQGVGILPEGDICWLNKARTRKVVMVAPHDMSSKEVKRLKEWIDLWYFVESDNAADDNVSVTTPD